MATIRPNETPKSQGSEPRPRHPICIPESIQHTQQKEQNDLCGLVRQARVPMVRKETTLFMDDLKSVIRHVPCPDCGSSDALCINEDGSTKCFSCQKFTPSSEAKNTTTTLPQSRMNLNDFTKQVRFVDGTFVAIPQRGIHRDTCVKFGYQLGEKFGQPCHVANYRNLEGNQVGQKYRFQDKSFQSAGDINVFFGQHLWPNGGKKLCITEGEIDALTVSQIQGNKWPVVSLPNGAASATAIFKRQLEWLSSWDEVVVMFDEDDAGRKAAQSVAHILPAGKCKIARLP